MLQYLRTKYPRLSQTLEDGVREGLENLNELRKERSQRPVGEKKRRRRRSPSRAPLGEQGFSEDDELDFSEPSGTKVFGRKERNGRMGSLPGQQVPVTAKLPEGRFNVEEALVVENALDREISLRAWVPLPDGERWRGERLPRGDDTGILGDFVRVLEAAEAMEWDDPPAGLVLTVHETGGRPATVFFEPVDGGIRLVAPVAVAASSDEPSP